MILRRFRLRSKVVEPGYTESPLVSYRMWKLKHLTAQFADESVKYALKGKSIQYELLECAIKGKSV